MVYGREISRLQDFLSRALCYELSHVRSIWAQFGLLVRFFHSRESLLIENLVLRQQLAVFKRKQIRPRLATMDKCFWIVVRRYWSSWKTALIGTHMELTQHLHVYRESATSALGELKKAGIIETGRKQIRILHRSRLERAAHE
jgi:Crp-like helix-turn-helix domain